MRPTQVQFLLDAQARLYGTDRTHSAAFLSAITRTCIAPPRPPADRRRTGSPHELVHGVFLASLTFYMSGGTQRAKPAGARPLDGRVRPTHKHCPQQRWPCATPLAKTRRLMIFVWPTFDHATSPGAVSLLPRPYSTARTEPSPRHFFQRAPAHASHHLGRPL